MYHVLSKYYNQLFSYSHKTKGFLSHFAVKNGYALDLGCGTGRLTHDLFELDMQVIGVDLDDHMIEVAKKNYPSIAFKTENMLNAFENVSYDLVTCFGNTFPHLNKEESMKMFDLISHHLNEEGTFIIQTLNYQRILEEKPRSLKPLQYENVRLTRNYTYADDHIIFSTLLDDGINKFEGKTMLYPYLYQDYKYFADQYDLNLEVYGDLDMKPLDENDYYMYVVINKKS